MDNSFLSIVDHLAAREPTLLETIFKVKQVNKAGIYVVQLYVDGIVQDIIIDDLLPCHPDTGLPIFATSIQEGEIWPCLLEKAWAKLHRSYCMIRLSPPTVCLAALTLGRPYQVLDHNEMKPE